MAPGTAPSAELAQLCTSSTKLRAANIPALCNLRRMWCLRVVAYTAMLDLSLKTCLRFSRQRARPGTVVKQVNSQAWHACTIGWLYWLLVARHSQRPQQVCETVAVNATHVICVRKGSRPAGHIIPDSSSCAHAASARANHGLQVSGCTSVRDGGRLLCCCSPSCRSISQSCLGTLRRLRLPIISLLALKAAWWARLAL